MYYKERKYLPVIKNTIDFKAYPNVRDINV